MVNETLKHSCFEIHVTDTIAHKHTHTTKKKRWTNCVILQLHKDKISQCSRKPSKESWAPALFAEHAFSGRPKLLLHGYQGNKNEQTYVKIISATRLTHQKGEARGALASTNIFCASTNDALL